MWFQSINLLWMGMILPTAVCAGMLVLGRQMDRCSCHLLYQNPPSILLTGSEGQMNYHVPLMYEETENASQLLIWRKEFDTEIQLNSQPHFPAPPQPPPPSPPSHLPATPCFAPQLLTVCSGNVSDTCEKYLLNSLSYHLPTSTCNYMMPQWLMSLVTRWQCENSEAAKWSILNMACEERALTFLYQRRWKRGWKWDLQNVRG